MRTFYLADGSRLCDEEAEEELSTGLPNPLGGQPLVVAKVTLIAPMYCFNVIVCCNFVNVANWPHSLLGRV